MSNDYNTDEDEGGSDAEQERDHEDEHELHDEGGPAGDGVQQAVQEGDDAVPGDVPLQGGHADQGEDVEQQQQPQQQQEPPPEDDGPPGQIQGAQDPGGDVNGNENYHEHPSHPKLRRKMGGDYEPVIETNVNVSRSDALYMSLGLARREKFTNTALCNALLLINALFAAPILPSTKDLLDGLLVSHVGVRYFFFLQLMFSFVW